MVLSTRNTTIRNMLADKHKNFNVHFLFSLTEDTKNALYKVARKFTYCTDFQRKMLVLTCIILLSRQNYTAILILEGYDPTNSSANAYKSVFHAPQRVWCGNDLDKDHFCQASRSWLEEFFCIYFAPFKQNKWSLNEHVLLLSTWQIKVRAIIWQRFD